MSATTDPIRDIEAVASAFRRELTVRYLRGEHTGGPARPRNSGIALAAGGWIALLDCDDWWNPRRLLTVAENLDNSVDVLYHPLEVVCPEAGFEARVRPRRRVKGQAISGDPFHEMLMRGNPIPNSGAVVRTSAIRGVGGFCEDADLVSFEDFDAWLSLARRSARFRFLPQVLGYYCISHDNLTAATERQLAGWTAVYRRHVHGLPPEVSARAESYYSYVVGTHLMRLGRPREALPALLAARTLAGPSLKAKRATRIVQALFQSFATRCRRGP